MVQLVMILLVMTVLKVMLIRNYKIKIAIITCTMLAFQSGRELMVHSHLVQLQDRFSNGLKAEKVKLVITARSKTCSRKLSTCVIADGKWSTMGCLQS